jgi:competence protein ComEA
MFGRRTSQDGDVVVAARRRLAALAVHHDSDRQPGAASDESSRDIPAPESGGSVSRAPQPLATLARHRGEPRTELGRWGVTSQHVTVVALCLLLLVILVAWWALRSVPQAQQVSLTGHRQLPESTVSTASPTIPQATVDAGATGSVVGETTQGSARVVIDVAGKVRHPGIVELAAGSRVVDAIAAAGGALPGISLTSINLARILVDGEQIVVGVRAPGVVGPRPSDAAGPGGSTTSAIARVELNTATLDQLDTLPGIGPVTAQAILQWRADNGPFAAVDELLEVSGIGDATLADIRPYVYV